MFVLFTEIKKFPLKKYYRFHVIFKCFAVQSVVMYLYMTFLRLDVWNTVRLARRR